ncbi:PREDICTED: probable protein ABIL5 isoform X2 [Nelumbo nucifera]|uniref:Probable protein ABIL5 isoform X2 n=1 Tax=Nelumbo nucifera TaxID=4432 RepID=A0A1U7ZAN4_NELNU|nr:PREDICTED: probable protein ABIL5 isoform X2 [Nelumbo nucifera]
MQNSEESRLAGKMDSDSDDDARFEKSMQELRDLRSQLHYAADYCEKAFLNAKQRKKVIENTKEYICKAVVTVVDHLGSISTNLECQISKNNEVPESELRIDCLKQRLLVCDQYTHKLALTEVRWSKNLPVHHPRYIAPPTPTLDKTNSELRYKRGTVEEVPLFLYTYAHKLPVDKDFTSSNGDKKHGYKFSKLLPVRDDSSMPVKIRNLSFHFQECRMKIVVVTWTVYLGCRLF